MVVKDWISYVGLMQQGLGKEEFNLKDNEYMSEILSYEDILSLLGNLSSEHYIDTTKLTSNDLENILKNSMLDVTRKVRDDRVEKYMGPPSFVAIFYYYIYHFQCVPTQQEYRDFYFLINKEWIHENVNEGLLEAFEGRIARTYPSLFRDIHFYFLLKETNAFKNVIYKLKYDLRGKVDIFVESNNNNWFGVQLRVNTSVSNYFAKNRKPYRNLIEIPGVKVIIDLPLKLFTARSIDTKKDDLKVYSNKELLELMKIINDIESNKIKE